MDVEDTLVSLVGQYRTHGLDSATFDALLREAAAGAEVLRGRLETLFAELSEENVGAFASVHPEQTPPSVQPSGIQVEFRKKLSSILQSGNHSQPR